MLNFDYQDYLILILTIIILFLIIFLEFFRHKNKNLIILMVSSTILILVVFQIIWSFIYMGNFGDGLLVQTWNIIDINGKN